ncbi:hypothetical protein F4780DRAFT_746093 [Xylariomycetidae sp. FL0641]|nr:hypothetical protein F4780DRAFT_746093 [Xylariomycetidae sp. FL0641]
MAPSAPNKRKLAASGLQRRVRARREEPEIDMEEDSSQGFQEGSEDDGDSDIPSDEDDQSQAPSDDEEEDNDEEDSDADDTALAASQLSFGALAKAQASLPGARPKKGRKTKDEHEPGDEDVKHHERDAGKPKPLPKPHRTSKHAPVEQSSKKRVSRKREVVSTHTVPSRDPRFSAASGAAMDAGRARAAYGFLDEYRASEVAQLKGALKKTRDEGERARLKRAIASMESRAQAQARKDAERELLAAHRQKEKQLVAEGKKERPFYLKKSEQKRRLLVDQFAGMKGRQVDRAIERRRKKLTSKERRDMPFARRERSG